MPQGFSWDGNDLGYGDLGCYSPDSKIPTPNLDKPIRKATVYHGSNGVLALRQGNWVLIDSKTGMVSNETEWFREERGVVEHKESLELFNIKQDPQQKHNVLTDNPKVIARMSKLIASYVESGRSVPKR